MINPLEPDLGSIQFKPVGYASGSVRIWQIIAQGACTHIFPLDAIRMGLMMFRAALTLNYKGGQHLDYDAHCTLGNLVICIE